MSNNKLPIRTKLFWGLGGLAEGVKTSVFNAFVLFYYNQILGVSATYTGIALAIAVLFDAISDPVTGSLSDKLNSRWGRRHPFMAASALPFGLTLFLLFVPPQGMSEVFYFGWVMVFAIAVRTFMTLYYIPHLAMGPEIATDYEDRSALFSFGLFFGALGAYSFYFVMLSTVFAPSPDLPNGLYRAEGYSQMSMTAGIVVCCAILLCAWGTRDQIPKLLLRSKDSDPEDSRSVITESFSPQRLFIELKTAFSSPSYRSIFLGLMLGTTVVAVETVLNAFMGIHFWGLETDQLRWIGIGVIVGLVPGTIVGAFLVKVLDKKWCLILPAALTTINLNVLIVLRLIGVLPEDYPNILQLLVIQSCIAGITAPVVFITINSMFADISDELELMTGKRQEGIIYSARAFALKAANALGTVIGGLALDAIAFPKQALPGSVDPDVIWNLGLVQGPLTSLVSFAGLLLYMGYRLSRSKHEEIVQALAERRSQSSEYRQGPENRV